MLKKWITAIAMIAFVFGGLSAQKDTHYTKASDSDPAAKAILEKLRTKYNSYQSLEADFTLEIQLPEQPKEVQRGTLARQGEKYKMDLASQGVISDGKALWIIMNNNKEVQINDIPEEETAGVLTPQSIFTFYDKGDFVYQLTTEYTDKQGRAIQEIEFKPLDRNADYTKLKLLVDKKKNEIVSATAFARDNSRYTFSIDKLTPNKSFAASTFTFDKSKYPGYYIEDLRE